MESTAEITQANTSHLDLQCVFVKQFHDKRH